MVAVRQPYSHHPAGRAAHRADIGFLEADGLPSLGDDHYFIVSLRQLDPSQFVAIVQDDGDQTTGSHRFELRKIGALDLAPAGDHSQIFRLFEVGYSHRCRHPLVGVQVDQVDDGDTLGGTSGVGHAVGLFGVDFTFVGEVQNGVQSVDGEQELHRVFLAGCHPRYAATTSHLRPVRAGWHTLDIAAPGNGDEYLFPGDKVLFIKVLARVGHNPGAALVAIFLLKLKHVFFDEAQNLVRIGQ